MKGGSRGRERGEEKGNSIIMCYYISGHYVFLFRLVRAVVGGWGRMEGLRQRTEG